MPRLVRTVPEVLAAFRARQNELDISNASIEALVGMSDRYLAKVLSPRRIKGLSPAMFQDLLDGLALGIVAIVIDEDPELAERMRPRWVKRKRPPTTPDFSGASLNIAGQCTFDFEDGREELIDAETLGSATTDDPCFSAASAGARSSSS